MTLKVMSWNVLAKHPAKIFLRETIVDLENRTKKRIQNILKETPDIILLQEFDRYFVEKLNENAEIAGNYNIHYEQDILLKEKYEQDKLLKKKYDPHNIFGNGIMVKKTNKNIETISELDTIFDNGALYDRKNAVYMDIMYKNKVIRIISMHLSGRIKEAREALYRAVSNRCSKQDYCIIGGDCNSIDLCMMPYYEGKKSTVCSFDYAERQGINDDDGLEIDKIFVKNMKITKFRVQNKGKCDIPRDVHKNIKKYGSDHFYILAHIEQRGRTSYKKTRKRKQRRSRAPSRKKPTSKSTSKLRCSRSGSRASSCHSNSGSRQL
jgi:endonuclease/exonuclease/phosphatase family metal-dependent hydrolase